MSNKYNNTHNMSPDVDNFISDNVSTGLSTTEYNSLEQPISFSELTEALRNMKKGKSPGSNGYTACFSNTFGISWVRCCTELLYSVRKIKNYRFRIEKESLL